MRILPGLLLVLLLAPQDAPKDYREALRGAADPAARRAVLEQAGAAWIRCELGDEALRELAGDLAKAPLDARATLEVLQSGALRPAAALLLPILKDPDAGLRRDAADALRRVYADEHAADLLPLLEDADAEVAGAAADALGRFAHEPAAAGLAKLIDRLRAQDPPPQEPLLRALEAAGRIARAELVPPVIACVPLRNMTLQLAASRAASRLPAKEVCEAAKAHFAHADPATRAIVLRLVAQVGAPGLRDDVVKLLGDPSEPVREAAIESIGVLGDKALAVHLLPFLKAKADTTRKIAATTLGVLKAKEHSDALLPLARDGNPNIQHSAMAALIRMDARDKLDEILQVMQGGLKPALGEALIYMIAAWQPREELGKLIEDLKGGRRGRGLWILRVSHNGWRYASKLAPQLESDSPETRLAALEALVSISARSVGAKVSEFAASGDRRLARLAVEQLGKAGDPARAGAVIPHLKSPEASMREAAAYSLARMEAGSAIPELVPLLDDPDPWIRTQAAFALSRAGAPPSALAKGARDLVWWVRVKAVEGLGLNGDSTTEPELVRASHDPAPHVRDQALRSLGLIGASERLAALLAAGPAQAEAEILLDSLAWTGTRLDAKSLAPWLGHANAEVRMRALPLADPAGGAALLEALAPLLTHGDPLLRRTALPLAARLRAPGSLAQCGARLHDPDASVVATAIDALADLGDLRCVSRLKAFAGSDHAMIRGAVAAAFGRMRVEPAVVARIHVDDEPNVRARSARALGAYRDAAHLPVLERRLVDPDPLVRLAGLEGLWAGAAIDAPLLEALEDESGEVREAATAALARVKGRDGVERLLHMADDARTFVRITACFELARLVDDARRATILETVEGLTMDPDDDVRLAGRAGRVMLGASTTAETRELLRALAARGGATWIRVGPALAEGLLGAHRAAWRSPRTWGPITTSAELAAEFAKAGLPLDPSGAFLVRASAAGVEASPAEMAAALLEPGWVPVVHGDKIALKSRRAALEHWKTTLK